jgi:hypothetical protein
MFRLWRVKLGLTQLEAGQALGLSVFPIRAYDQGRKNPPRLVLLAMTSVARGLQPYGQPSSPRPAARAAA